MFKSKILLPQNIFTMELLFKFVYINLFLTFKSLITQSLGFTVQWCLFVCIAPFGRRACIFKHLAVTISIIVSESVHSSSASSQIRQCTGISWWQRPVQIKLKVRIEIILLEFNLISISFSSHKRNNVYLDLALKILH